MSSLESSSVSSPTSSS
jgi:hypothetical protein